MSNMLDMQNLEQGVNMVLAVLMASGLTYLGVMLVTPLANGDRDSLNAQFRFWTGIVALSASFVVLILQSARPDFAQTYALLTMTALIWMIDITTARGQMRTREYIYQGGGDIGA